MKIVNRKLVPTALIGLVCASLALFSGLVLSNKTAGNPTWIVVVCLIFCVVLVGLRSLQARVAAGASAERKAILGRSWIGSIVIVALLVGGLIFSTVVESFLISIITSALILIVSISLLLYPLGNRASSN